MHIKHGSINLEIVQAKTFGKNVTVLFSFANKLFKDSNKFSTTKVFCDLDKCEDAPSCIYHYSATKPHVILNLGSKSKFSVAVYAKALADLSQCIKTNPKIKALDIVLEPEIATLLKQDVSYFAEQTIFNFVNGLYQFDDFKLNKSKIALSKLTVIAAQDVKSSINQAVSLVEGVFFAKDLGNNPANVMTPTHVAELVTKMAKLDKKIEVKIIDEKEAKKLKMFSFLSVSNGSKEEAKMITLSYNGGAKSAKPIVLVGKGVTFDSGGISIKPRNNMEDMKYDMMGAATVLATFFTAAKLNLPINLVAITPCTENLISGSATKPGDIVTSMSGQTIEIINTDAEGRLILCDALTYAKRYKPECVIDVATLTGACLVALGRVCSGMYSNDDVLAQKLLASGLKVNDKVWQMPLFSEYLEPMKNTIADLCNTSGWSSDAGSVTAAKFLETFIDYKWAHLDIAGVAYNRSQPYNGIAAGGATGRPFYLLIDFLRSYKA